MLFFFLACAICTICSVIWLFGIFMYTRQGDKCGEHGSSEPDGYSPHVGRLAADHTDSDLLFTYFYAWDYLKEIRRT